MVGYLKKKTLKILTCWHWCLTCQIPHCRAPAHSSTWWVVITHGASWTLGWCPVDWSLPPSEGTLTATHRLLHQIENAVAWCTNCMVFQNWFWILHFAFQLSGTWHSSSSSLASHVSLFFHFISGAGPFVAVQRHGLAAMVWGTFGGSRNDAMDSKVELFRGLLQTASGEL